MKKFTLVAVIAMVACVFCSCSFSSPKGVVDSYFKALQKGELEKALSYTTMDDNEIQSQVEKLNGIKFQVYDYEIQNEVIDKDNNTATVQVKYKYSSIFNKESDMIDGEETVKSIKLVKKDGKWKITE